MDYIENIKATNTMKWAEARVFVDVMEENMNMNVFTKLTHL